MAQSHTLFNASTNGFKFVNRFTLPFPTTIKLPLINDIDLKSIVYGLCGGMCFASLDYFNDHQPVPSYTDGDTLPHNYLIYLWDRQVDSLGLVVIPRVIEWMLHPDRELWLRMSRYEIPKLRRRLDQGTPVVLGLVRARGVADPTVNHQVLAIGYTYDETTRQMEIFLSDPNYVGVETSISLNLTSPSQGLQLSQSTGEATRGLFTISYSAQHPPQGQ